MRPRAGIATTQRKALRQVLGPKRVTKALRPRPPTYDEQVLARVRKVWVVMDAPAGKRMTPFMGEMVARLRACGELDLTEEAAAKLSTMSAATSDRRLAGERKRLQLRGGSATKPGTC